MRLLFAFLFSTAALSGSANMAMSAIAVNASGQMVITMSPCVSPLSLSSGSVITGLSIGDSNNQNAQNVAASSLSGCTVTVTTQSNGTSYFPIFADDGTSAVTATLATSSNLQDASGNTVSASGNSGVAAATNSSAWQAAGGSLFAANAQLDGNPSVQSTAHANTLQWATADGCVRFNSTATSINALLFNYLTIVKVFQDGTAIGSNTVTGSGTNWTVYTVASGLSGSHLYELCEVNGNAIIQGMGAVQLVGGSYGSKPAARPWVLFFGASEIACQFTFTSDNCLAWQTARAWGYADQTEGYAGWPVTSNGGADTSTNLRDCVKGTTLCTPANGFTFGSASPAYVFIDNGGNDAIGSTTIGTGYTTAGTFGGDAVTLFENAATRWSPTAIYVFDEYCAPGIGTCPNDAQVAYQTAWHGAAAYYNTLSPTVPVILVPTWGMQCVPSTQFQSGGNHPTAAGYSSWANCLAPVMAGIANGVSYSTAGALSGRQFFPSSSITSTLGGSATFASGNSCSSSTLAGCQTYTLSDGGSSGSFAITGGSGGATCASPCTVTPTNGASSFSWTYTPALSSPITISFTNAQGTGWPNPSPLSYTPSAVVSTFIIIGQ